MLESHRRRLSAAGDSCSEGLPRTCHSRHTRRPAKTLSKILRPLAPRGMQPRLAYVSQDSSLQQQRAPLPPMQHRSAAVGQAGNGHDTSQRRRCVRPGHKAHMIVSLSRTGTSSAPQYCSHCPICSPARHNHIIPMQTCLCSLARYAMFPGAIATLSQTEIAML